MLNEALRLIRVYHDINQSELAHRLGLSKSYLSEIESGRKKVSLDLVDKYSQEFQIPPSSIMFFSENMGKHVAVEGTRRAVASKILNFLKFLERQSEDVEAN